MVYLDNAATSLQKPPKVARASASAIQLAGGAGRGGHFAAARAAGILYECRELAATLLGVSSIERIVMTMNATHALNIAIKSLASPGCRVAVSGFEHNAVIRPLRALERSIGISILELDTPLFQPDRAVAAFRDALSSGAADMAVCIHVSNVFGYILPVEEIGAICRQYSVPFIIDAAQSAGVLKINADAMPEAFWCMPGHKGLYGPQGTGLLICPENCTVHGIMEGGTGGMSLERDMPDFLPERLEAGTQNIHGIAGLCEGIRHCLSVGESQMLAHERALMQLCSEELRDIPGLTLYSAPDSSLQTGVLSFKLDALDNERVASDLSERGIALRPGLHCAPSAHKTAGTLPDGTLRASFGYYNSPRDVRELVRALSAIKRLT